MLWLLEGVASAGTDTSCRLYIWTGRTMLFSLYLATSILGLSNCDAVLIWTPIPPIVSGKNGVLLAGAVLVHGNVKLHKVQRIQQQQHAATDDVAICSNALRSLECRARNTYRSTMPGACNLTIAGPMASALITRLGCSWLHWSHCSSRWASTTPSPTTVSASVRKQTSLLLLPKCHLRM